MRRWGRDVLVALATFTFETTGFCGQPDIGVYMWAGKQGATNLREKFIPFWGAPPEYAIEFTEMTSWANMENSGSWAISSWKGVTKNLVMSVPLTVRGTALYEVVGGQHDSSFLLLAHSLVANGFPHAVVRIGWEMNAGWYPWGNLSDGSAEKQQTKIDAYKAAFARVARLFRTVSPTFRINWCPAGGYLQVPTPSLYPGDDVVDEIGLDLYAQVWGVEKPTSSQVQAAWNRGWQLEWIAGFSKAHGKPFSFPEFGIGDRPHGSANYGPGDSGATAAYAVGWMRAHAPRDRPAAPGEIAWVGLWNVNAGDYNSQFTGGQRPNIANIYKSELAPQGATKSR